MIDRGFLRFCSIGVIGFIVDSGLLLILVRGFQLMPLPGRVGSFLVAATVTYALNRPFTFQQRHKASVRQWFAYVVTTGLGAMVNIGIYHAWVAAVGASPIHLVIGVALGSGIALFLNYSMSRWVVFRAKV